MPARRSFRHRQLRALASREPEGSSSRSVNAERPATFAEALVGSDIAPLAQGNRRVPARPAKEARPAPVHWQFSIEEEDAWLSGYRLDAGANVLTRLRGAPRATLDLHGESADGARRRLAPFLAAQRVSVSAIVLVIVGKGRHSPGGHAVLRQEISTWLTTAPLATHVLAFRTAPRELGGSGGVLVLLAPTRSRRSAK
jgi:DNA-nicking Smr family endonuclease